MKAYRLDFDDKTFSMVIAKNIHDLVSKFDLCSKKNINTRVTELDGLLAKMVLNPDRSSF